MGTAQLRLKPSAAGRWVHCPGSVSMETAFPSPDNVFNLDGGAAHKAAALLLGGLATDTVGFQAPGGIIIDKEMQDAALIYVEDIKQTVPHSIIHIEERVDISYIHPNCKGVQQRPSGAAC